MKNFNKNSFLHNLWSKIARKREATCDKNCELLKMYEEIQRAVENPETKLRGIKQQYQKSQVHAGMVQWYIHELEEEVEEIQNVWDAMQFLQ